MVGLPTIWRNMLHCPSRVSKVVNIYIHYKLLFNHTNDACQTKKKKKPLRNIIFLLVPSTVTAGRERRLTISLVPPAQIQGAVRQSYSCQPPVCLLIFARISTNHLQALPIPPDVAQANTKRLHRFWCGRQSSGTASVWFGDSFSTPESYLSPAIRVSEGSFAFLRTGIFADGMF